METKFRKTDKPIFMARLEKVKLRLPVNYGAILTHKYPHFDKKGIYNVVHNCIMNYEILNALETEFPETEN